MTTFTRTWPRLGLVFAAFGMVAAPLSAQVETIDPNSAIDGDLVEQPGDQVGLIGQMCDHRREEMCLLDLEVRPQRMREKGDHPVRLRPPDERPVRPRRR